MIDLKLLEKKSENGPSYLDEYRQCLVHRGAEASVLDQVMELNRKRKELITQAETAKSHQNKVSGEIAVMKRNGQDTSSLIKEMGEISSSVKEMEAKATEAESKVLDLLMTLPNKTHSSVPVGKSGDENVQMKKVGEPTKFNFKAKEHWELGEKLGLIDFERAGKVTGTRFAFLTGKGARLERALIQYFMDLHSDKHGYTEMIPPYIVNTPSYVGTGQFPKFKQDVFHLAGTDYFLISTAEVPVTNFYREEILKEEDLPLKFCAYSPCFRSEAGAAGRDTKASI